MQKQIDEYKLSPKNELILQDRLHQVDELQKNITETRQVFTKYVENGNEMCQNVLNLVKNFESLIGFDKSLRPIVNILSKFSTVLSKHYKYVEESIINQIDELANSELKEAENDGKAANKEYSSFSKLLDSYVSIPTKKRSQNSEFNDLQAKLLAQNWTAIKSNFSFSRSLGLIERKRVLEMTSHFISFANHLAESFNECSQIYEESKDNFNIIQQALPSTVDELSDYKIQSSRLELTLQKVFYMYFKSFNEATVYKNTDELTNEGFLWMKKPKFKKWEKRYCILKYGLLSVFKTSTKPAKTYKLLCSTVKPIEDNERPSCFTVISTDYKFVFQALTSYERDKWINTIQNNIEWLLTSSSPTKSNHSPYPQPNGYQPGMSLNEPLEKIRSSTILRISKPPMNSCCADCGAKSPTWVCINWTTVICIQCSGVHRFLTTSVSKVRSTTLDNIDDVTMQLFDIIGNSHANAILEEGLIEGTASESANVSCEHPKTAPESTDNVGAHQNASTEQTEKVCDHPNATANASTTKNNASTTENNASTTENNASKAENNASTTENNASKAETNASNAAAGVVCGHKISCECSKDERELFITQKYKNLAFVKKVTVDIEDAIRKSDILLIYRSICTGQIHQFQSALHYAASCGDPLVCRLIALNMKDPNILIDGWSPLSYASYYGQLKAAEVLLISGCFPDSAKPEAHPYRIAMLKQDDEMAALFYPYWNKSQITGQLEEPPHSF